MAGCKLSREFLEDVKDSFLVQALDGPTRVVHSWICYSEMRKKVVGNVNLNGSLVCTDHEITKLEILGGR